jgi:hypothetical protein
LPRMLANDTTSKNWKKKTKKNIGPKYLYFFFF